MNTGFDGPTYAYKVLECIDGTEYLALSDASKDILRLVLSVGILDMGLNSRCREIMNLVFPSGVTHDAIDARWPAQ